MEDPRRHEDQHSGQSGQGNVLQQTRAGSAMQGGGSAETGSLSAAPDEATIAVRQGLRSRERSRRARQDASRTYPTKSRPTFTSYPPWSANARVVAADWLRTTRATTRRPGRRFPTPTTTGRPSQTAERRERSSEHGNTVGVKTETAHDDGGTDQRHERARSLRSIRSETATTTKVLTPMPRAQALVWRVAHHRLESMKRGAADDGMPTGRGAGARQL